MPSWTLEEYCKAQPPPLDLDAVDAKTKTFFVNLDLPFVHPFCGPDAPQEPYEVDGAPVMGPLKTSFPEASHPNMISKMVTVWHVASPSLLAMGELWLRLFAAALAPLCILYLVWWNLWQPPTDSGGNTNDSSQKQQQRQQNSAKNGDAGLSLSFACIIGVASSLVVMTDTLYVLEFGPEYGCCLFLSAVCISTYTCMRRGMPRTSTCITALVLLAAHLIWDRTSSSTVTFGDANDRIDIEEGLYHDPSNAFVHSIVEEWPERHRTYSAETGKTQWIPTGDSRTGLPFLLNKVEPVNFTRTFFETDDGEVTALDVAVPPGGHDPAKPVFLILHGLSGGSKEEYIQDFVHHANENGSTAIIFVARGLMDLPLRGWDNFHGARISDVHGAAKLVRRMMAKYGSDEDQLLVAVGYSMGAIILSNYVAKYGADVAVDAAMPISGGLDMRHQTHFYRAQRLWQPMLTQTLRADFLLGKWGERVRERLSDDDMLRVLRASHITEIDKHAIVPYNGFDDLDHYYRSMSALGDIPVEEYEQNDDANGKGAIQTVSIPFCVVHALDDPLISWRTAAANRGFLRPDNLVRSGSGNTMMLLTKGGGHVGWPTGLIPFFGNWEWMSQLPLSFADAIIRAKRKKGKEREEDATTAAAATATAATEAAMETTEATAGASQASE